jgi:hypothetical protein
MSFNQAALGRPKTRLTVCPGPPQPPHFDTITVSVADAPRPDEILVAMAIADGGRLRNRCGTEPIR